MSYVTRSVEDLHNEALGSVTKIYVKEVTFKEHLKGNTYVSREKVFGDKLQST